MHKTYKIQNRKQRHTGTTHVVQEIEEGRFYGTVGAKTTKLSASAYKKKCRIFHKFVLKQTINRRTDEQRCNSKIQPFKATASQRHKNHLNSLANGDKSQIATVRRNEYRHCTSKRTTAKKRRFFVSLSIIIKTNGNSDDVDGGYGVFFCRHINQELKSKQKNTRS